MIPAKVLCSEGFYCGGSDWAHWLWFQRRLNSFAPAWTRDNNWGWQRTKYNNRGLSPAKAGMIRKRNARRRWPRSNCSATAHAHPHGTEPLICEHAASWFRDADSNEYEISEIRNIIIVVCFKFRMCVNAALPDNVMMLFSVFAFMKVWVLQVEVIP